MDQMTRRIIGFAVHAGNPDGPAICRLFNQIVTAAPSLPRSISSDNDPLFEFHRWKANLRILEIDELETVPSVPFSHPFVERLIGTVRRMEHICSYTNGPKLTPIHSRNSTLYLITFSAGG
jgi:hypothetical protein